MTETTVVGLNLTDVTTEGSAEPLTETLLGLSVAASRLVVLPNEAAGARMALTATREAVRAEMPHMAALLDQVLTLLDVAETITKEA